MILQSFDFSRLIGVALNQSFVIILFFLMSYLILRRNKNRLSKTFASFYLCEAVGFIFGMLYLPFKINLLANILYFFAILFIFFGPTLLLTFLLILLQSEVIFTKKKQMIILSIYFMIYLIILLIIGLLLEGFQINESTGWRPHYSLPFFMFLVTYVSTIVVPTMYFSITIYQKFQNPQLKSRWVQFLIGMVGFMFILYGLMLYIFWSNELYRFIWGFISPAVIIFGYLIYRGTGRQL
ncbi:MAG: hypothetical protein EU547_04775 [Promethearchaeota archaeon]|nr:MAG: hypothetical protein EU547_04775 [Candidatus Lokiarchaeota archaeon]